jgi:hypothetical protein
MRKNMGRADRIIRFIIAVVLIILTYTLSMGHILKIILGIIALILVITSLVGTCPLYMLFRISTKKKIQ